MREIVKRILRIGFFTLSQIIMNYVLTTGIGWKFAQLVYEPRLGVPGQEWTNHLALMLATSIIAVIVFNVLVEIDEMNKPRTKWITAFVTVVFILTLFSLVDDSVSKFPMRSYFSYLCLISSFVIRLTLLEMLADRLAKFKLSDWQEPVEKREPLDS